MELKNIEKLEYIKGKGIIVDGKKYGLGISKVEIDGVKIRVYIGKSILKSFEEMIKEKQWEDYNNPYDLIKYENINIIEE